VEGPAARRRFRLHPHGVLNMTTFEITCSCTSADGFEDAVGCPLHDPKRPSVRIADLSGLRSTPLARDHRLNEADLAVLQAAARPGPVVHYGSAMLRPYVQPEPAPTTATAAGCICSLETFGAVEICPVHGLEVANTDHSRIPLPETAPAMPQIAPLSLLLAASTLIPTQPTTEQWQTIKNAIRALVPGPEPI
jgi:hypothetical protein